MTRCTRVLWVVFLMGVCFVESAFAGTAPSSSVGTVAQTLTDSFASIAKLVTAIAYIAGLGFAVASIFKFKAHKDNPQQVTIGTPLALLFIGVALIFMPSVFSIVGHTVFGASGTVGGATGTTFNEKYY